MLNIARAKTLQFTKTLVGDGNGFANRGCKVPDQTVHIKWFTFDTPPKEPGTYLVAFEDYTVESYPISSDDILTGRVTDGRVIGVYWAHSFESPDAD